MRYLSAAVLSALTSVSVDGQNAPQSIELTNPSRIDTISMAARRLALGAESDFLRVVAILPRADGRFIVVNSGTSELRFYDASGRLYATVGRRGQGPGEYQRIQAVGWLKTDSIAVFDPGARRISILGPMGEFARSLPLRPPFEGGGAPTSMVPLETGTLLVGFSEIQRMAPQPTPSYFRQRVFQYSSAGEILDSAGWFFASSEHFVQATVPSMGGVAYWNLAFGRVMTIRPDSSTVLAGDGSDWTVDRILPNGATITRYRLQRPVASVTEADKEAYRRSALEGAQGQQREVAERMGREMPFPARKPAYRRFEPDHSGRIWLETYPELGDEQPVWLRIDTRSRNTIAIRWPSRFRPLAFRGSLAYGIWRDQDDVEHVHVYAIRDR